MATKTWWTKKREKAVALVTEGYLTLEEISAELGISHSTLYCWRRRPEFEERVEAILEETRKALREKSLARIRELEPRRLERTRRATFRPWGKPVPSQ